MRRAVLALSTCLLVVSGCSGTDGSATNQGNLGPEPALGPGADINDKQFLDLPLDFYQPTREQNDLIVKAQLVLVNKCMARFGFEPIPSTTEDTPRMTDARYGINVAAEVQQYGYHRVPEQVHKSSGGKKPSEAEQNILTGRGQSVHNGVPVPPGGCLAEARSTMSGVKTDAESYDENVAIGLKGESMDRLRSDSRVRAAYAKWTECMKQSGFDYRDPWAANNDSQWTGESANKEEVRTALADLACRRQADVNNVSYAVDTAYQKQSIEKNAEVLRAQRALLENVLRKAGEIVGG
ncbi:hypothetical protein V5P93_000085 [Actinokineospora auranticolor]|uniref:Lipoprotein n=1 Tax=Actinokineospora auranticolor TaxID=155976 RepID=A0A2S6GBV4_9PSEU|nr:hypothetical protein [Actinokineospora auranticolor]PPK61755.1 hypothetical protein CLV40_13952 [Actinokineospora auranticolor]